MKNNKTNGKISIEEGLNLEYPYYSSYYNLDKKRILNKVNSFKPIIYTKNKPPNILIKNNSEFEKFENNYFIIKDEWKKNEELNYLTDYFSEKVRIKCIFTNHPSPFDFWKKNKKRIIKKTLQKYNNLKISYLKEMIYNNTKLCNNFRISIVLTVLKHFQHDRYLDISAGWGDRLLGAIFSNVKRYISADPNLDLQPCYNEIKKTFLKKSQLNNFIIYPMSFLDIPLEKEEPFDIVFSSPPFFTLEKYSQYNANSITKYSNEQKWIDDFFIKSLIKCYNHLKKDGHILLYMGGSKKVFDNMFRLNKIMNYLGIIHFYEPRSPYRNIFVWKKINNDKINSIPI